MVTVVTLKIMVAQKNRNSAQTELEKDQTERQDEVSTRKFWNLVICMLVGRNIGNARRQGTAENYFSWIGRLSLHLISPSLQCLITIFVKIGTTYGRQEGALGIKRHSMRWYEDVYRLEDWWGSWRERCERPWVYRTAEGTLRGTKILRYCIVGSRARQPAAFRHLHLMIDTCTQIKYPSQD